MQQDRWHFASESLQTPVGSVYSQSKYGDQYGLKKKNMALEAETEIIIYIEIWTRQMEKSKFK